MLTAVGGNCKWSNGGEGELVCRPHRDATRAEAFPGARELLGANHGPASCIQTRTPPLSVLVQRKVAVSDPVSSPRKCLRERPSPRRRTL